MDKSIHSHLYHQVIGRLRGKRERLGITQVQLAELLKVNQTFVSRIETCDRRLDIIELHHICQVLGIRLSTSSRKSIGIFCAKEKVND